MLNSNAMTELAPAIAQKDCMGAVHSLKDIPKCHIVAVTDSKDEATPPLFLTVSQHPFMLLHAHVCEVTALQNHFVIRTYTYSIHKAS